MKTSRKFKPLPHQPGQAPANLNQPLSERNASKRAKRHADNENARDPDQRLMERDDIDVRGRRIYTFRWLRNMDSIMRLWCEFFQTKLGRLDGPDYFKPGGPRPDRLLLHRFLFWIADTSVGTLYTASHEPSTMTETTKVTTGTVERYIIVLSSAFGYFNSTLDSDLIKSARYWVRNDLSRELSLNREIKEKPVAYTADVEQLIEAVWSFNSISVFKSVRAMFNTTLVLNNLVDGASRIGEFVPTDTDSKEKGRYLKWQDLQFFMLPSDDADGITIHIVVLCKWLKRQSYNTGGFKSFVVRLLPPHLIFQDSCRLLVVLALYHGYFRDFRTWDEILTCKPSRHGSPILLKSSCMELPVFLPLRPQLSQMDVVDFPAENTNPDTDLEPWTYCQLQRVVQHMSRLAGFAQKTGLHQLRHGDAYLLAQHCKDRDTARNLMGQQTESEAFSTYISKTSTTDVQGLAHRIAPYDLTPFSGLSLGKCSNAPVTLPAEELAAIDCHPEFIEVLEESEEAKRACTDQFGSIQETRKAAKQSALALQLLQRYEALMANKNWKWKRLAELRFRAFREEAVRELTAAKPAIVGMSDSFEQPESTLPIMDNYRALDAGAEEDTGSEEDHQLFLKDRVEDIGQLTADQATSLIAALSDDTTNCDAEEAVQEALNQQVRKHNIFRNLLDSMVGAIGRHSTQMTAFSYDYAHLRMKYDMVAKNEDVTSSTAMALLLELLSNEHHMRDLPAHWISPHDASRCVVCGDQLSIDTAYTHVYQCLQSQAKTQADKLWDDYCANLPTKCTWVPTVKSKACKVDLTNATPQERQKHFHKHNNSPGYKCYWDGCNVIFSSQGELCQHVYCTHRIMLWTSSICMYFWCHYCHKNIFEIKSTPERLAHFAAHHDQAIQAVQDYGYAGVYIGSSHAGHREQEFLPAHCVFCLHNEAIDAEDRLVTPRRREIAPHMHTHFRYLTSDDLIHCPASSAGGARHPLCQYEQAMTPTEAWVHIQKVHYGLEFGPKWGPEASGKSRAKRRIEQDDEGREVVKVRTKVYDKLKPVVAQSGQLPKKMDAKSAVPICQSLEPTLPLREKSANTALTAEQVSTPKKQLIDYEHSVIDPMLR